MAAHEVSSSSCSSKLWKYDVFLSFRGEDTRQGFTGHLYQALEGKGYKTFIDEDDLKRGEEIKPELLLAIEESRISIIVFSKRYADSSWCLDELVKIMECRSKLGQHVLPIFYDVETSDIRKQKGSLAPMFQKHEKDIRKEKEVNKRGAKRKRVEQWREALTEAANLSGHDLKNTENGHEAKLIQKIINENLWEWLPRTKKLHVAKFPVRINSRVQKIITDLSSGEGNKVLMVGIWGMGGLGKTTAAKAIYNQIHPKFEFKSFLDDVSDTTSRHGGLVYLQKKLISDILNPKSEISSVAEGIGLIKDEFSHRKVLVVMDNIDKMEQLDAIAGNHDWFGPGSRIIITTRDKHLLLNVDKVYLAQKLKDGESLELFSWHAFGNSWPDKEYLELSKKIVSYCDGLPLALEVLGSFLFKRTIGEWECQLKKLKTTPEGEIIKPLKISFEGLDDTQKAIFLDISCFFIGEDKDIVTKVLDECEFFATIGINVLCERCLVTVEYNRLNMHDLLREMARVIISGKSPSHPGKWSRLWNSQDVINVLTNKSGTPKIEGLALHFPHPSLSSTCQNEETEIASFSTKAFAKMKKLRLLNLSRVELNGEYKHLPKELIWLNWFGCPLKSIPDDFFNQDKLVVLDMRCSKLVKVWEGSKSLHNLKILDLSCSDSLQKSPDFSQVPNLEELILQDCHSLFEIHPSIGHLKRLYCVNLSRCYELISLPRDFYKLKSVETLLLNYCSKFIELHEDIGEMISLRTLEAVQTAIREVPPSMVRLKNLTCLSLSGMKSIHLPHSLHGLNSLRELNLSWCKLADDAIPKDLGSLISLQVLTMQCSKLVQVWEGSKSLQNLKILDLSCSDSLQKSPDFSQVPNLEELILQDCHSLSEIHPSTGHLKRLSLVNLSRCYELISLPRDFYKLKSVETLLLNHCSKFIELHEDIGEMISLRTLEAERTSIREVPPSIVRLKNLTRLSLSGVESIHLPHSLHGLNSLRELNLSWCKLADDAIPKDLGSLISLQVLKMQCSKLVQVCEGSKSLHNLKTLDLSRSYSLQKSPDISQVPNLEKLILQDCHSLSEIHPSIGHLKRLYWVDLSRCSELISLPRDFYKLKSIKTLCLNYCSKFRELHEDIGEMISLRTLEAHHTSITQVPPSIVGLKNLTRLSLDRISYVELNGKYKHLPKELIWLRWDECPLKSIPDDLFNQDKLVVLQMQCSKLVQVWEGSKSLQNLKTLDLSYSYDLQKSPDFSQVPNLEELILENCWRLTEIHPSIGHLKRLSLLNLKWCDKLISLPRDFYKSKSVETLLLNYCRKFRELHEDIGEMISLRTLEAEDTAIREVSPSIVGLKNLTRLSLSDVESIHLPHSLHGLNSLRELDLSSCRLADNEIPKDLGSLISLQVLDLSVNDFHTLPSLSGLSKLETLRLDKCFNLRTIPDIPPNVKVQHE